MKKYVISLLMLIVVLSFSVSAAPSKTPTPDFRQASWGMTIEEVKKLEQNDVLFSSEKYLLYLDTLQEFQVYVYYDFSQPILTHAYYTFILDDSDVATHFLYYNSIRYYVSLKYGAPISDDLFFYDKAFSHYKSSPQIVIDQCYGYYETIWETDTTYICLQFYKPNDLYDIKLHYVSIKYFQEYNEARTSGF